MAGPFTAGQRITAALLNSFCAPVAAIKAADQSVASSVALINDTALVVPVVASATYLFDYYLDYEGISSGGGTAGGLKHQWTIPAGATLRFGVAFLQTNLTTFQDWVTFTESQVINAGTQAVATLDSVKGSGTLITGVTAGNLQMQWAQAFSSATATIVHAQSKVNLWRIT